jgi:DNA-binding CsgD family transcriptional regulator
MKHAGQVVTRTMLLENVWDYHFDPQTNVIDVHISRLTAAGYSAKTIALKLQIGVKSVETYKKRCMTKLGFQSRVELIHYAIGKGWLSAP